MLGDNKVCTFAYITKILFSPKMKENNINVTKSLNLKSLTKSTVWDIQENDVFRILDAAGKDSEIKDNIRHYADILRSAFVIEELKEDDMRSQKKFENLGYKIGTVKLDENSKVTWALKKKPIARVTDLTYENIRHITAAKLVEVLERNFGGGWDSLSQSIQDIIESGFDISTTTLPKDRLHKKGGMYERKIEDGYDVLEIEKGTWVEAIFAKVKPEIQKPRIKYNETPVDPDDDNEDADVEIVDDFNKPDEDDIMEIEEPNDEDITEDNYRTTFALIDEDDEDAESLSDYIADE